MMKNMDCLKERARVRYIDKMSKLRLQHSSLSVLLRLVLQANEQGVVHGQLKDLLRDLKLSRSTHTRVLLTLESLSLVKRVAGGFVLPELAHVYYHVLTKLDFIPEPPDASPVSQNVCTDDVSHHYKENKNNYIKNLKEKGGSSVGHTAPDKSAIDKLKALARSEASRIRNAVFGSRVGTFEHPTTSLFLEGFGGIDGLRQMSEKNARFRLSTYQVTKAFLALAGEDRSIGGVAIVEGNRIGRAVFCGKPLKVDHPATHAFLREHSGTDGLRKLPRANVLYLLSTYQLTQFFRDFDEGYETLRLETSPKPLAQDNGKMTTMTISKTIQRQIKWPKVSASTLQRSKEIASGILIQIGDNHA